MYIYRVNPRYSVIEPFGLTPSLVLQVSRAATTQLESSRAAEFAAVEALAAAREVAQVCHFDDDICIPTKHHREPPAGRGVTSRPASLLQSERQSTQRHETSRNLHTRHEAAHKHIGDGHEEGAGITDTQTQHATHNSAQILRGGGGGARPTTRAAGPLWLTPVRRDDYNAKEVRAHQNRGRLHSETEKRRPNTGARANNTLHK